MTGDSAGVVDRSLTREERMVVDMVGDFARSELAPIARDLDAAGRVPREQIAAMQDLGLFGLQIPEEYGGTEVRAVVYVRVIEELARACAGVAIAVSVHNSVASYPILAFGTEEQKRRFLPDLATRRIGAFCLSEAGSGSDAASLATRAERSGGPDGEWILRGTKLWVSNATQAGLYLVFGRSDPEAALPHRGITAFLVERDRPGIVISREEDKMGLRADDTAEVVFDGVRVPDANRLGAEGAGFRVAMSALDNGRMGVGAQAVGIARAAFDEARAYARARRQFGRSIAEFGGIRLRLAEMESEMEAAALLVYRAAARKDAGEVYGVEASMAKLYASEMATRVTHGAIQIHGGYGYVKEYPVERYARDARVTEIYEGTSEMQRLVIARSILAAASSAAPRETIEDPSGPEASPNSC